ncbi:MAG: extracellular solute-binding protein [Opitutaceae bacterium]|jgi:raffinose/stachyose/melibiose transport system substrate-binding protein|nr:extracellular solute-binding protein [Opitutaceae bacterium]
MKRESLLPTAGLCLLAACFLFSIFRVVVRDRGHDAADGRVVIRFAHWQLEGGLRETFDQMARDYERLHPGVRVEQLAIPERTYGQWVRTQLIGGTAPDLVQLGLGTDAEVLARFFTPITSSVGLPNPHNAGTPLEGLPWRETILDGMTAAPGYQAALLENYGVPVSMFSIRMYRNVPLWRAALGDTPVPRTFDEFVDILGRMREWSSESGRSVIPIAGSRLNTGMLISALTQNQTQRLLQEKIAGPTLRATPQEIGLRLLRGDWTTRDPAFLDALGIAREVALHMPPGFNQLGREDASFYFTQGRALMITTGSWDGPSFRAQVNFEIDVFDLPFPDRTHPRYGRNLYGRASEAELGGGLAFGITRSSAHSELALDFLRYLTSHPGNTRFARLSGWLPSVAGVDPGEDIRAFMPRADGYGPGFDITLNKLGANTQRAQDANIHLLFAPSGSVDLFEAAYGGQLAAEAAADLRRNLQSSRLNSSRQDIALLAWHFLGLHGSDPEAAAKRDAIAESQHAAESVSLWMSAELDALSE